MKFEILSGRIKYYTPILKDPQRKNIIVILFEYLKFRIKNKSIADQYFGKYFYRKGSGNFTNYLLSDELERKCWGLNNKVYISLLDNKYLFERYFSQFNLRVIKSKAYNHNSLFFQDDRISQINSGQEFKRFLTSLSEDKALKKGIFIKKNEGSYGGADIFKVTPGDIETRNAELENIYNRVVNSGFLFQEIIIQDERLNQINPSCINTIRIDTYTNKKNENKIMSGFMRIGINSSHVDNISSGGVFVGINIENGTLFSEAMSDIQVSQGRSFTVHPVTGFRLEGFQIPYFQEIKNVVLEAARQVPQLKIVGWDIAITPDGPVIVEGNARPGLTVSEIAQKGFYNNPVFSELLAEIS